MEQKEYTITFFKIQVQDDYTLICDGVDRSNAVPNEDIGEGWIHGYMEGFSESYEYFFEEISLHPDGFRVLRGSTIYVFYLHNGELKTDDPPRELFIDNYASFDRDERLSVRAGEKKMLKDVQEAIEDYLVNEEARRSMDDNERRMVDVL